MINNFIHSDIREIYRINLLSFHSMVSPPPLYDSRGCDIRLPLLPLALMEYVIPCRHFIKRKEVQNVIHPLHFPAPICLVWR